MSFLTCFWRLRAYNRPDHVMLVESALPLSRLATSELLNFHKRKQLVEKRKKRIDRKKDVYCCFCESRRLSLATNLNVCLKNERRLGLGPRVYIGERMGLSCSLTRYKMTLFASYFPALFIDE